MSLEYVSLFTIHASFSLNLCYLILLKLFLNNWGLANLDSGKNSFLSSHIMLYFVSHAWVDIVLRLNCFCVIIEIYFINFIQEYQVI